MSHQHVFFPHSVFRVTFLQTAMDITDIIRYGSQLEPVDQTLAAACQNGVTAHQKHESRTWQGEVEIWTPPNIKTSMSVQCSAISALPAVFQHGSVFSCGGSRAQHSAWVAVCMCRRLAVLLNLQHVEHSVTSQPTFAQRHAPIQLGRPGNGMTLLGPWAWHSAFVPPTSFRSSKAIHLRRSAHEDRLLISTAVSGLLHWTASSYQTRRYVSSNSKESWEPMGDFGHVQSSFIRSEVQNAVLHYWFQIDRAQENTILWGLNCSQLFSQPQAAELIMPVSTWKFCHVISCKWRRERHQWDTLAVAITIVP